jgi:hypothetical protein
MPAEVGDKILEGNVSLKIVPFLGWSGSTILNQPLSAAMASLIAMISASEAI